ncbi:biotin transporter BioY [Rhizobium sp. TRM95111]|uniref:biotin transporter BioY n=1 Tax=Rhizobium alarense TaxID=2846851 RepID=UPI001F41DA81|nr:biotin transporter BioY [Rhizobium alarense]MCF3641958.1 biotin transporter BioY [Rhizobium alarense]
MSGLEEAIKNALARSERQNPETRARIYQSARNALEAGLKKQDIRDPDVVAAQRHRLEEIIHHIEAEERRAAQPRPAAMERAEPRLETPTQEGARRPAAVPVVDVSPDAGRREPAPAHAADDAVMGDLRPQRADRFGAASQPAVATQSDTARAASDASADFRPERAAKPRRRRGRLFSLFLVAATLVAAAGSAYWWVESSGLLLSPAERDGSVPNPPDTLAGEDFAGEDPLLKALETQSRFSSDWKEIFAPQDAADLSAGTGAVAEPVTTNEGAAVRVTSRTADRNGAVAIAVPPEVLEAMAGKSSTIALTMQATDGKPVQVAVECDFGSLGTCGRHRFTVSDRTDLLFEVDFDRSLVPNAAGKLYVVADVGGGGASVNLFGARILPGQ